MSFDNDHVAKSRVADNFCHFDILKITLKSEKSAILPLTFWFWILPIVPFFGGFYGVFTGLSVELLAHVTHFIGFQEENFLCGTPTVALSAFVNSAMW